MGIYTTCVLSHTHTLTLTQIHTVRDHTHTRLCRMSALFLISIYSYQQVHFNSFGEIRENVKVLLLFPFFPPKLSMKSALLRFRILFHCLTYSIVNKCSLQLDQQGLLQSHRVQADDTKLTNHTSVSQNNQELSRKSMDRTLYKQN